MVNGKVRQQHEWSMAKSDNNTNGQWQSKTTTRMDNGKVRKHEWSMAKSDNNTNGQWQSQTTTQMDNGKIRQHTGQ